MCGDEIGISATAIGFATGTTLTVATGVGKKVNVSLETGSMAQEILNSPEYRALEEAVGDGGS